MRASTAALIAALACALGFAAGYFTSSTVVQQQCEEHGRIVMDGHVIYDCSRRDE